MFEGFSQETVDFMWGIRFNNEREWFMAHKEDYQKFFLKPMQELGREVQEKLTEKFPDSMLNLKVSRIYRDARRLFGRGPYKDHLWISLFRWDMGEEDSSPMMWFELAPDGWSYGMGFWMPKALTMAKYRARMDNHPETMLRLAEMFRGQSEFALTGAEYARPKAVPHPDLAEWYNRRSLALSHEEPLEELLYSHDLVDRLVEGFTFLMPYHDYLSTLWADPAPKESQ